MDDQLLAAARQAQERLVAARREAAAARTGFRASVRRLVSGGCPPRDAAAALGLSHDQLGEILRDDARPGRRAALSLSCSFCGAPQLKAGHLIAGSRAYICDACVQRAGRMLGVDVSRTPLGALRAVPEQDSQVECCFCGKPRHRVADLAVLTVPSAGPGEEAGPDESGGFGDATSAGEAADDAGAAGGGGADEDAEAADEGGNDAEAARPVTICVECLALCEEIIAEQLGLPPGG